MKTGKPLTISSVRGNYTSQTIIVETSSEKNDDSAINTHSKPAHMVYKTTAQAHGHLTRLDSRNFILLGGPQEVSGGFQSFLLVTLGG